MSRTRTGTDRTYTHLFLVGAELYRWTETLWKIGFGDKRSHVNISYFHDCFNRYLLRKNVLFSGQPS
jgi:hypothetical protein